jgi:hypothetical protein
MRRDIDQRRYWPMLAGLRQQPSSIPACDSLVVQQDQPNVRLP